MNIYYNARQLLPKMPEEIFKLWFDGRIDANGWPPVGAAWQGALRNKPFNIWQKLEWEKRNVVLNINRFTPSAKHIINGLIEANFNGVPNIYSLWIQDSKKRILSIMEYIKINKALPGSLILMEDGGYYEIVDGSHRLAVFFALHSSPKIKQILQEEYEVWMGFIRSN
jgi:hypothetical protein